MTTTSIISLQDAKTWLRYPSPSTASNDDASLQVVIDAAQILIESRVGVTVPRVVDEYHTPNGGSKIWLREVPVLEIVSVTESWLAVNFELDFQQPDTGPTIGGSGSNSSTQAAASKLWAYSLDVPEIGEVTRRGPMNIPLNFFPSDRGVRVIYRAGRNPVPASLQLAAQELTAHIWQNAELRSMAASNAYVQYDTVTGVASTRPDTAQAFWYGVPKRIAGLLESDTVKLPAMA